MFERFGSEEHISLLGSEVTDWFVIEKVVCKIEVEIIANINKFI
jgi:hypothetical protein